MIKAKTFQPTKKISAGSYAFLALILKRSAHQVSAWKKKTLLKAYKAAQENTIFKNKTRDKSSPALVLFFMFPFFTIFPLPE
jgi:hypothetical protein